MFDIVSISKFKVIHAYKVETVIHTLYWEKCSEKALQPLKVIRENTWNIEEMYYDKFGIINS